MSFEMNKLAVEFCKWVETNPVVSCKEPPTDLDKFVYFKKDDSGNHYRVPLDKIPIKFKPLVKKNGKA
jgi:hypothetical protein